MIDNKSYLLSIYTKAQHLVSDTLKEISTYQQFLWILVPKVWAVEESFSKMGMGIQTFLESTNFWFPNWYKFLKLYIWKEFYIVLSGRVCPKSTQPRGIVWSIPYVYIFMRFLQASWEFDLVTTLKRWFIYFFKIYFIAIFLLRINIIVVFTCTINIYI